MKNAKEMSLSLDPTLTISTVYVLDPVGKKGHCKLVGQAVIDDKNGNRIASGKTESVAWKLAYSKLRIKSKK